MSLDPTSSPLGSSTSPTPTRHFQLFLSVGNYFLNSLIDACKHHVKQTKWKLLWMNQSGPPFGLPFTPRPLPGVLRVPSDQRASSRAKCPALTSYKVHLHQVPARDGCHSLSPSPLAHAMFQPHQTSAYSLKDPKLFPTSMCLFMQFTLIYCLCPPQIRFITQGPLQMPPPT